MAVREIITIDEELCNGCGECIPGCPEGALQIIDGKARLVSDLFCDGLGACIGTCPTGAITVEKREAVPYDEYKTMTNIIPQGEGTIAAHLRHLLDHRQDEFYRQALECLKDHGIRNPLEKNDATAKASGCASGGCPGSRLMQFEMQRHETPEASGSIQSRLGQWPIQLALLNPDAPIFDGADLLVSADCAPFAYADFHRRFLEGKTLMIFCPKLDRDLEMYIEKLARIFKNNSIASVSVVHMEVPCCGGVGKVVKAAVRRSGKNVVIRDYTISIRGEII